MTETVFLALWLEAPLQSWGADSKFYRRETTEFPTKSGILGMVCCSLGRGGEQKEFLSQFKGLSQTILAFDKSSKQPVLYDFQTIGTGYKINKEDKWLNNFIPKKSDGKSATNSTGAKLTYKAYLQDKAFGVILEVPTFLKEEIIEGLKNPKWDLYFGRKNCTPTDLVYRGEFALEIEAENLINKIAQSKKLNSRFALYDMNNFKDDNQYSLIEKLYLNDVPLQFGSIKKYSCRTVVKVIF
jgi:CRISPR system Cascade subunit CasD